MKSTFLRTVLLSLLIGVGLSFGTIHIADAARLTDQISGSSNQSLTCDEYAWHEHGCENTTPVTPDVESYARIFKYRIYLHDDFMQNVDFDELWCSSPFGAIQDCGDGQIHTHTGYGGTEVRLVQNDRSSDAVHPNYIEWEYGKDDPYDSPVISSVYGATQDREISELVNFVFKDSISSGTASTTAAVWIKFMEYDVACGRQFGAGDSRCWENVEEDDVPGTTDYHWNNETSRITSHYECEGELTCDRLEWDSAGLHSGNTFDVSRLFNSPGPFITARAFDTNGTEITNNVQFRYQAFDINGTRSRLGNFFFGGLTRGNNVTTAENVIRYANSQPGDTIRAEVVGFENVCVQELEFPYCADLDLDPNGTVTTDGLIQLAVDVFANNGQRWPYNLRYDTTDSAGRFDGNRRPHVTTDRDVSFQTTATTGEVSVEAVHDTANLCADNFQFVQETNPFCEDLSLDAPTNLEELTRNEDEICFTFETQVSEPRFSGTLRADVDRGQVTLNVTGVGSDSGDPARVDIAGQLRYSGTLCWENYDPDGEVTLEVVNEALCYDEYNLDVQELVCTDLELTPDRLTIDADERDSGEFDLEVVVRSSDSEWEGNLIIESDGTCDLSYANGDEGERNGRQLSFDVDGRTDRVFAIADGCKDTDEIEAYIQGERNVCEDNLVIEQDDDEELFCDDLDFDPGQVTIEDGDDEEVIIDIDSELDDQTLVITYEGCRGGEIIYDRDEYEDELEIDGIDGDERIRVEFTNLCEDAEIEAYIKEDRSCKDELIVREDFDFEPGPVNESIFTFNFEIENDAFSDENVFFTHDEDRAFYTTEYDPQGYEDTVVFRSRMWDSRIEGRFGTGQNSGGTVELVRSYDDLVRGKNGSEYNYTAIQSMGFGFGPGHYLEVGSEAIRNQIMARSRDGFLPYAAYVKPPQGESYLLASCDDRPNDPCYDPGFSPNDSGDPRVVVRNADRLNRDDKIRIRTVGIVNNGLDCSRNQDACLTEQFTDEAEVEIFPGGDRVTSEAQLVSLCSYLLTRNAGDVYLEVDLVSGSDVSCIFVDEDEITSGRYRNTDALVILEEGGGGSTQVPPYLNPYSGTTISLCDDSEFSDNLIGNLSSYVCEIVSSVTDILARENVEKNTDSRVSQATRNATTNQGTKTQFNSWGELELLKNANNPASGVLYFEGNGNAIELTGDIIVPEGAWTLVVENADLIIHDDIRYANSSNFQNLPSIAFIVSGGNIGVKNTAGYLSGVFYTDQEFTGNDRSPVNEPLEVLGSLYGNIQKLLNAAQYVGSPTVEGGGLTVRYDSRILLNTPPGLSEYVDITTREAVN